MELCLRYLSYVLFLFKVDFNRNEYIFLGMYNECIYAPYIIRALLGCHYQNGIAKIFLFFFSFNLKIKEIQFP
jgi:hypothetical protein